MLFINIKLKFETATSDIHQLITIKFKVKPDKWPPRIIKYRDYKNFERKGFNNKLQVSLKNFDINNFSFIELKQYLRNFWIKLPF